MRKRDLVHLHALFVAVRRWLAERHSEPDGAYDAYEELGVSPTAINRRKHDHERAVRTLLDGIEATVAAAEESPTADRTSAGPPSSDDPSTGDDRWSTWNAQR